MTRTPDGGRVEPIERTGLFVVRAWMEAPTGGCRARVTFTTDLASGRDGEVVRMTDDPDEIAAMLTWWIRALTA